MRLEMVPFSRLVALPELTRSARSRVFEDRLRSSISEIGLSEPIKVALTDTGQYAVVDGNLRIRAIEAIRGDDPSRFEHVPSYVIDFDLRFEVRFQSDIYQDLLPSQVAAFVEHLHESERVRKTDIARYIGVSPATLRNYTGLWRMMGRGGLFAGVVHLMDHGIVPASNPYAWLRLTEAGIRKVLVDDFSKGEDPRAWIDSVVAGNTPSSRYSIKFVEAATSDLEPIYYREDQTVRSQKKELGLRRSERQAHKTTNFEAASRRLQAAQLSANDVLRVAAVAMMKAV